MKYKIKYTETLHHVFYVDAATSEDAKLKFDRLVETGKIDFCNGQVLDTDINIEEVSKVKIKK